MAADSWAFGRRREVLDEKFLLGLHRRMFGSVWRWAEKFRQTERNFIHPFPKGNGRHARLAADLLAVQLGQPRLTWGQSNLAAAGEVRRLYIEALRAADGHDLAPLLAFVRS